VYVQGEEDNACGLYCLATVGAWLGTIEPSGFATTQIWTGLKTLGWNDCRCAQLYNEGLLHCDVAALATACGLEARSIDGSALEDLDPGMPVLVYVAVNGLCSPRSSRPPLSFTHYVVALERVRDATGRDWVVIADPHPWRPLHRTDGLAHQIYAVAADQLLHAWSRATDWERIPQAQRRPGRAWSLRRHEPGG
jgi:hypothetical protein